MREAILGTKGAAIIAACLALQVAVLAVASGFLFQMSVFCTGPASSTVGTLFGVVHLLFLIAFLAGAFSLFVSWLRPPYLLFLLAALPALPAQVWLVENRALTCDLP